MPTRVRLVFEKLSTSDDIVLGTDVHGALSNMVVAPRELDHSVRRWSLAYTPDHPDDQGRISCDVLWLDDEANIMGALAEYEAHTDGLVVFHGHPYLLLDFSRTDVAAAEELLHGPVSRAWQWNFLSPTFHVASGTAFLEPRLSTILSGLSREWSRLNPGAAVDRDVVRRLSDHADLHDAEVHTVTMPMGARRLPSGAKTHRGTPLSGYVGSITIRLTDDAQETDARVLSHLSRWAAWTGVGSQTAHGCGTVTTSPVATT